MPRTERSTLIIADVLKKQKSTVASDYRTLSSNTMEQKDDLCVGKDYRLMFALLQGKCYFYAIGRRRDMDIISNIKRYITEKNDFGAYQDLLLLCQDDLTLKENRDNVVWLSDQCEKGILRSSGDMVGKLYYLHESVLKTAAPFDFESYMLFTEWNRELNTQFYRPRRKQLKPITNLLQKLEDDELDLVAVSCPPGIGKSTLALFYLTWLAGKYPDLGNLTGSHNGDFIKGCYEECMRMTAVNSEYRWQEVFPGIDLVKADAKSQRIDFGTRSPRRETLQFTTVGSGNAGLYRAMKLLYCDDLVSGLEVALSKDALDKLWGIYTTDLKQRKLGYSDPKTGKTIPAKELHIATRWSVHDIIGRLEEQYSDSDRACFLRMPVMDENGESLFDYKNAPGYPTSVIMDIKDSMDEPSFQALYMNEPIEREGLLFPTEELRYYSELPRDSKGKVKEPDSIIAICDTKDKGQDYAFEPIAYVYGQDYYIEDCICDNGLPAVVDIRLAEMLLKHNVRVARYESNNAGRRTAEKVQEYVKRKGGITHITTKDTTANKITKIIAESPWVISHCLFKTKDQYVRNSDYGRMMNFINTFTMSGKNKHDDVPDGLAQLSQYAQSFAKNYRIFKRPW